MPSTVCPCASKSIERSWHSMRGAPLVVSRGTEASGWPNDEDDAPLAAVWGVFALSRRGPKPNHDLLALAGAGAGHGGCLAGADAK